MTPMDTSPRLLLLGYGNVARTFLPLLAYGVLSDLISIQRTRNNL